MDIKDDPISGIPKLTGTMDIFDGYPAVLAAYNLGHYENTDHVQLMRPGKVTFCQCRESLIFHG